LIRDEEHDAVRKKLLFSNVLVEDMKVGIAENGRKRNKLGKQHMLSGRIIRSYRFSSKPTFISSTRNLKIKVFSGLHRVLLDLSHVFS
jgi:hypothetical protein